MTKREALKRALSSAAWILESTAEGGWPDDVEDAKDMEKMQDAMHRIANRLGRRFAMLQLADVRRQRRKVTKRGRNAVMV